MVFPDTFPISYPTFLLFPDVFALSRRFFCSFPTFFLLFPDVFCKSIELLLALFIKPGFSSGLR